MIFGGGILFGRRANNNNEQSKPRKHTGKVTAATLVLFASGLSAATATALTATPAAAVTVPGAPSGWTTVFSDSFSGAGYGGARGRIKFGAGAPNDAFPEGIEDFFATPGAKAAFENSDWMCMLSQKSGSINALAESKKISMDEAKRFALESLTTRQGQYSEIMICDAEGKKCHRREGGIAGRARIGTQHTQVFIST